MSGLDRVRGLLGLLLISSALGALARVPAGALASDSSLCERPEQNYFSCQTRNGKLIELCGGKAVEYRFGKPGKIELLYPKAPGDAPMRFAHHAQPLTDRVEVSFSSGGADYRVFDYSEGKKRTAGVRSTSSKGKEVTNACNGPIVSRLAALRTVLPCDTDSALNGGNCP